MVDQDKALKFCDPKTGEVFEDIEKARIVYCAGRDCNTNCRIAFKRPTCNCWAKDHPAEAARLMGFEVVEDEKLKGENKKMELKDTIEMMNSEDYKARFKAEYLQTKIRYEKLHKMCIKYEAGTLSFTPSCSLELLREQKGYMGNYLRVLEVRAEIEGICLDT